MHHRHESPDTNRVCVQGSHRLQKARRNLCRPTRIHVCAKNASPAKSRPNLCRPIQIGVCAISNTKQIGPQWPCDKVSASCSKPYSTNNPPCKWTLCTLNLTSRVKYLPVDVAWKSEEGLPAQASSSSSEFSSK
ncbi:hypothetical protein AVEN_149809-1 [Araneus ventricosus]|uniref:Uncharacterized protein n=1 Tax=Araneus ventricosus TaxID=182803 RepID=A0A4Y2JSZ9_ARAVE|nr:hypothetical protein AVEN_149809-1 [Araneus ventricosus]